MRPKNFLQRTLMPPTRHIFSVKAIAVGTRRNVICQSIKCKNPFLVLANDSDLNFCAKSACIYHRSILYPA